MTSKIKYLTLLLVIGGFFPVIAQVQGHGPSSMSLSYDLETNMLNISISHSVSNPDTHYIESITIFINDVEETTKTYTSQDSTTGGEYQIEIEASIGDKIKATATCNQGGLITREITVGDTNNGNGETEETSFQVLFGLVSLIGLTITNIMKKKH